MIRVMSKNEAGVSPKTSSIGIQEQRSIIANDVARTFNVMKGYGAKERAQLREQLQVLLEQLLDRNPNFNYFQGLNHLAAGFLLVLSPSWSLEANEAVCKHHFQYLFM